MKHRVTAVLLYISLLGFTLTACGNPAAVAGEVDATGTEPQAATPTFIEESTTEPATDGAGAGEATVQDYAGLVAALQGAGAKVEAAGEVAQPFFGPPGQVVKVNGGDVQVFEYPEAEVVARDANQVAPDGSSVGTQVMLWMATPHFFKSGRLIVLYVGDDAGVTALLAGALGPQFAGR